MMEKVLKKDGQASCLAAGSAEIAVRKAGVGDVKAVFALVKEFARRGEMLARPIEEIYARLRDFFIAESDGEIIGIVSLHIWGEDLAEVRSLAVAEPFRRLGAGSALVEAALDEALALGLKRVFALTYAVNFFVKMGFKVVDKAQLPQKIWGDCRLCRKFPGCDETAVQMVLG